LWKRPLADNQYLSETKKGNLYSDRKERGGRGCDERVEKIKKPGRGKVDRGGDLKRYLGGGAVG